MRQPSRERGVMVGALCFTAVFATVTGCSSSGSITCDEYAAQSFDEKGETIRSLLVEHRLESNDVGNTVGASSTVDGFCGTIAIQSGKATRNESIPIEQAIDWDSPTW